ncbi:MAG: flagellar hook capping FlgD N-terminal domain-containing protein [Burkholderiaceae bacterium]
MPNINLLSSNSQTDSAWASAVPSSIKTTAGAAEAALTANAKSGMGQKDFLTLFTTQLKNQDPLDPVKNEAFVAQLAQFSQLEATTNMSSTLTDFVASMSSNQITASANLIGKKVSVADAPAQLVGGQPIQGIVSLPIGAQGIQFQVFDDKGMLVNTQILGAQTAGDMTWAWDGVNDAGAPLPDGSYRFVATAVIQGKTSNPKVSTMASVIGVSQQADKSMLLQIQGGKTVKLSEVNRIDG